MPERVTRRVLRRRECKPGVLKHSEVEGDTAPLLAALSASVSMLCSDAGLAASCESFMFSLLKPVAITCRTQAHVGSNMSKNPENADIGSNTPLHSLASDR